MQCIVNIALCTARVGQDCTIFQIGQDFFHHRYDLQNRRAEINNIRSPDHRRKIRRGAVHRTTFHRCTHGLLGAAESRDIDLLTERILQTKSERSADEPDTDDGELRSAHTRRPTAGAI